MEEKILQELQEIKKELQDIRSILEPVKLNVLLDGNQITAARLESELALIEASRQVKAKCQCLV